MAGKNELRITLLGVDRVSGPLRAVQQQVSRTTSSLNGATSSMRGYTQGAGLANTATQKWAKGALQQAGYQVGDFAVQLANGTNGLQAFGQQAPQLLQIFGPMGAVIGAAVAVIAAFGVVAQKTGKDINNLGSALGVLQAPLTVIAEKVASVSAAFTNLFSGLPNQLDTIMIAVGLFAAVMVSRAIPSMIAASGASAMFSASMMTFRAALLASTISAGGFSVVLTTVRAAVMTLGAALSAVGTILMRFLPVALLIGLATMIKYFLVLKKGAGGLGEALKLLSDLALAVFRGMGQSLSGFYLLAQSASKGIDAAFVSAFAAIMKKWEDLVNTMISGWNAFADAVGLTGARAAKYTSEWASDATETVTRLRSEAMALAGQSKTAFTSAGAGIKTAWAAIKSAIAAGTTEVSIFGDAAKKAAEDGAKAAKDAKEEIDKVYQGLRESISSSMEGAFMSIIDGTSNAKDAFKKMASSIISELYRVLVVQRMVSGIMNFLGFGATGATGVASAVIGARATGGSVAGNKPYIVGERGPELMIPGRSGTVVPNDKISNDGGVTIIQNNSFGAGVSRAEIQAMMPKIVETTKAAVLDARKRGGSYGSAFA